MAKGTDVFKQHQFILKNSEKIASRYLELHSKDKVAKEFGISVGGVDSALIAAGHPELASKWMRESRGIVLEPASITEETAPEETTAKTEAPKEVLDPKEVASELLRQVVDSVTNYNKLDSEARTLRGQVKSLTEENSTLESRLKKAVEEKERAIRVHNELVKQSNGGKLPTVEEVVAVLRRDHTYGKPL